MKIQNNTTSTNSQYIPGSQDIAGIKEIFKSLTFMSGVPQTPEVIIMYDIPDIVEIREIPHEQAKSEIIQLVRSTDQIYYSEISDKLHLDIELVVSICRELEVEGLVQGANQ